MVKAAKPYNILFLAILTLCVFFQNSAFSKANVNVEPLNVEIKFTWSKRVMSKTVKFMNTGSDTARIDIQVADMAQDIEGNIMLAASRPSYSAAGSISLDQYSFDLPPGRSFGIELKALAPERFEGGGGYALLHIKYSTVGSRAEVSEMLLPVNIMFPGRQEVKGKISGLSITQEKKGSPISISTVFLNSGNIHLPLNCEVHIKDKSGREVKVLKVNKALVLPGHSCTVNVSLKADALPEGVYAVESRVDFGPGSDKSRETLSILNPLELANFTARLDDFEFFSAEKNKSLKFQFVVSNPGNVGLKFPKCTISVLNDKKDSVDSLSFKGGSVSAGTKKKYTGHFPRALPAGNYTAVLKIEDQNNRPITSESAFKILDISPIVSGEVSNFSVLSNRSQDIDSFLDASFMFKNKGNIDLAVTGTIEISDSYGAVLEKKGIEEDTVETGRSKLFKVKWNCDLPRGVYDATLKTLFGNKHSVVKTKFSVTP